MFDIGFSELLLVFVIGLVVLGPERLPVAVRTVAAWIRTLRSMAASVQNELNQELKLQELQDSLKKAEEAGLKNLSPEIKSSIDDLKEAASSMKRSITLDLDPADKSIAAAKDEGNTIHNPLLKDATAHYEEGISPASADQVASAPVVTPESTITADVAPPAGAASAPASKPIEPPAAAIESQPAVKSAPSSQPTGER